MSRTVIMMLFASALNIILGFAVCVPLVWLPSFGMAPMPTLSLSSAWLAKPLAIIGAMALAMLISLGVNILCLQRKR